MGRQGRRDSRRRRLDGLATDNRSGQPVGPHDMATASVESQGDRHEENEDPDHEQQAGGELMDPDPAVESPTTGGPRPVSVHRLSSLPADGRVATLPASPGALWTDTETAGELRPRSRVAIV